jgi:hypothetical protein
LSYTFKRLITGLALHVPLISRCWPSLAAPEVNAFMIMLSLIGPGMLSYIYKDAIVHVQAHCISIQGYARIYRSILTIYTSEMPYCRTYTKACAMLGK